ncbi:hypothetical protein XU18_4998 [Perkinsela sp. CCAP 1560/4]|nr:hypothetical protein XU18_4998 [Perkinsela sp. CCAP 1560/4]|eukprot:KNH03658.1 hypothetical protein XU18_4998 [Perkinsela sp. CCAP 1560/4]
MRGRRSADTTLSPALMDIDPDTSDESYKASSDEDQPVERYHLKKKSTCDRNELDWFSSIVGAAGNSTRVGRVKRIVKNSHPFLRRSDSCFHVEWCDTLQRFFYTDTFTRTLHEMESPASTGETLNEDTQTKDIGFSLAVDFSRFRSVDDTTQKRKEEVPSSSEEQQRDKQTIHGSKMNTAEAALATWKSLKAADPEMAEELQLHQKGKNVYLDERNFLQQSNEKQDELRLQMEMDSKRHGM